MCPVSTVVASWYPTQAVPGSSLFKDKYFFPEFAEFSENIYQFCLTAVSS